MAGWLRWQQALGTTPVATSDANRPGGAQGQGEGAGVSNWMEAGRWWPILLANRLHGGAVEREEKERRSPMLP